jgi:hypothetical protein
MKGTRSQWEDYTSGPARAPGAERLAGPGVQRGPLGPLGDQVPVGLRRADGYLQANDLKRSLT